MKKKVIVVLIIAVIVYLIWPKLVLVKVTDRSASDIQLPQDLKQRITEETHSLDVGGVIDYSIKLTAEKLKFTEQNDIEKGEANCVGYAKLCSSICNYGLRVNHLPGKTKPVVGYVKWAGINLCDMLKTLAPAKYKSFVKDHDFVEYCVKENFIYASMNFDPSLYDLLGSKCMTYSEKHDARFHNAKEIKEYYGVKIPEVELIDSQYESMNTGAWLSEYYNNTYLLKNTLTQNTLNNAVKQLNSIDLHDGGDVEAGLIENDIKLQIKFHFVTDTSGN